MDFSPFVLISLFYVVIGVRSVTKLVQSWGKVWDRSFTLRDRQMVDEAAFFVLVPISVALHELGHAVAVWGFGREVVDFGFYGFAGFVSYVPFGLSAVQMTVIAGAGTAVNLALCVAALGIVFLRPFRAPVNELLLQFAIISGANAFILYPILDLASGLNGDWRQMYDSGVPWLTAMIVAVQVGVIAFGYRLFSDPKLKARSATLTDVPAGMERGLLGGVRPGTIDIAALSPAERALREATERVQSGWTGTMENALHRFDGGTAMALSWQRNGAPLAVAVRTFDTGRTDIVTLNADASTQHAHPKLLHAWGQVPPVDELTMTLRVAMETVERAADR